MRLFGFSVVIFGLILPSIVCAFPDHGVNTGKPCMYCHFSPSGGGQLTDDGRAFKANGLKLPDSGKGDSAAKNSSGSNGGSTLGSGSSASGDRSGSGSGSNTGGQGGIVYSGSGQANDKEKHKSEKAARMTAIERKALIMRKENARKVYVNAIKKGYHLFHEPGVLGAGIQSCADCHKSSDLSLKLASYPRWNEELSSVITFDRKLRHCIFKKMNGRPLPPESSSTIALKVYLKEVKKGTVK